MQLAKATVTKRETCSRCKGKGYGTWRPDMSRCWKCFGEGTVAVSWDGADVHALGWVARPAQLERGTAPVREILMIISKASGKGGAYRLSVYTFKLDGSIHYWTTTEEAQAGAVTHRAGQALQREMSEDRAAQLISELDLFPGFKRAEVA